MVLFLLPGMLVTSLTAYSSSPQVVSERDGSAATLEDENASTQELPEDAIQILQDVKNHLIKGMVGMNFGRGQICPK